jgi:flagellar hook-length control protein FliK
MVDQAATDQQAAAAAAPGNPAVPVAVPRPQGERVFVAAWSLDSSEIAPVVVPEGGTSDDAEEPVAVEEDGQGEEADSAPVTVVANIPTADWLRMTAIPVVPGGQQQSSGAAGQTIDADAAVPEGTGTVQVEPDAQAQSAVAAAEPLEVEPAVELTGKAAVKRGSTAPRPAEPAPKDGEPVPTAARAAEPAAVPDLAFARVAEEVTAEIASAPKFSAAAQFSKAMERIGGPALQNGTSPVEVQQDGASGEQANFSSTGDQQPALNSGAGKLSQGGQAFTTQFASELHRQPQAPATAASAPTAAVPDQAAAAPDGDTALQIVQAMRLQFRDGIGDAVVRLKPGHLGEVSISLRVDHQSVSATVHAEVPAVRQWLESQESSLRSGLADQGLHLEKFVVKEDQPRQGEKEAQDAEAREHARRMFRQRRAESEQKFEVIV